MAAYSRWSTGVRALAILAAAGALLPREARPQTAPEPSRTSEAHLVETKPWTGDFDGMVARRRVRILTPYSRTGYFIDRGQPRGVVAELAASLEDAINAQLKTSRANRVFVIVRPTSRDELHAALTEGRGDIVAAGLTVTPERARIVDFTVPLGTGAKEVLVTGPGAAIVVTIDDLSGKQVVVREKSIYFESLTKASDGLKARGKAPIAIRTVPATLEDEDILEMVSAGLIKAAVVDDYVANFWRQLLPGLTVHADIVFRDGGAVAWAVRKGSPKLLAVLNPFIATHGAGSAFGNVVLKKYLQSTRVVRAATSAAELTKFAALREAFERYGDKYDLDHVLMMAQGYQESRLDQSVRSHVGAVGVMQVMPATGKELNVGDIHQVEANIHAGVKYIRFMIDRYYANEPMDRVNKMLFAFASYNAGPGRIRGLRATARQRGLDPNVWFNNVEHIASERIGRETVQYVSNIYKYYIAYQLALEETAERKAIREKVSGGH